MESGELTVVGQDSYQITLVGAPSKVEVRFKDHYVPVPCNTHHQDDLVAVVSQPTAGTFVLTISWLVGSVRDVQWKVWF